MRGFGGFLFLEILVLVKGWVMELGCAVLPRFLSKVVVDAQFCPGYCVSFHFWVLGSFVVSFELGPRTLSLSYYFILSSL